MQTTKKTYNLQSLNFLQNRHLNVGILGGSFNPAHAGHLLISKQALKALSLDYVIWLVALQNPLKSKYQSDIFSRAKEAAKVASCSRILVSTAEHDIGCVYTYDMLKTLRLRFSLVNFTWIMGIDNIKDFHKWRRYEEIPNLCKIAIFDRPGYSSYFDSSRFSMKFKPVVAKTQTSDIIFYRGATLEISSSRIRENLKNANL